MTSWIDENCALCDLCKNRKNVVPGKWARGSGILPEGMDTFVVGEAPGVNEDLTGECFVGKTGEELFSNYLKQGGIDPNTCYFTNIVKCLPTSQDKKPKKEHIDACKPYLWKELESGLPRYIIAMGSTASKFFLGANHNVERAHGNAFNVEIPLPSGKLQCAVIVTYHPAAGLHTTSIMQEIYEDFVFAGKVIRDGLLERSTIPVDRYAKEENYRKITTVSELEDVFRPDIPKIALDTETVSGEPYCLSFSQHPGEAFVIFQSNSDVLSALNQNILENSLISILHNATFDLPVLEKMGVKIANFVDTMSMAYLLGNKPKKLKLLAYRIAGMHMHMYSDILKMGDARRIQRYLLDACREEWKDAPIKISGWEPRSNVKEKTVVKRMERLDSVGMLTKDVLDRMISKGEVPRVTQARNIGNKAEAYFIKSCDNRENPYSLWNSTKPEDGREEVEKVLGKMPEPSLLDVPEDVVIRYSARDADATFRIYPILAEEIREFGLEDTLYRDMGTIPMICDMEQRGILVDLNHFKHLSEKYGEELASIEAEINKIAGWDVNVRSTKDLQQLLFVDLGLEQVKTTNKGNISTDMETLTTLQGSHSVVDLLLQYRKLHKLKSTYIDSIPKHADSRSRVHSRFSITRTETGRLASSEPNQQNQPKRGEGAKDIRRGYIAPPDYSFVSADYSQIELRVLAHISKDPSLLQAFNNNEDVHNKTACDIFGVSSPTKSQRRVAKTVNFGVVYCIQPDGLQRKLFEIGIDWDVDKCSEFIADYFKLRPAVKKYIESTKAYAKRNKLVRDIFGRIRYIPEVRSAHYWIREAGLRQAVNTRIQSSAQGIIKEAMRRMIPAYRGLGNVHPLIQIHDDLLFEVEDRLLREFISKLSHTMSMAVTLVVPTPVSVEVGKNWGDMEEWK